MIIEVLPRLNKSCVYYDVGLIFTVMGLIINDSQTAHMGEFAFKSTLDLICAYFSPVMI